MDLQLRVFELALNVPENAVLEYIRVLVDHFGQIFHLSCLIPRPCLQPSNRGKVGHDLLLEGAQNFSNNLPDFGLHLEPLELFEHSLLVHNATLITLLNSIDKA